MLDRRSLMLGGAAALAGSRASGGIFTQVATGYTLTDPGRPTSIVTDTFPHSCCLGEGSDAGSILVSCGQGATCMKVNPVTGSFVRATIGAYPAHNTLGICSAFNKAWLADIATSQVAVVDYSTTPPTVAFMPVGSGPRDVGSDGAHIWVTESSQPAISAYDPASRARVARVTLPAGAQPYRLRFDQVGGRFLYAVDFALSKLYEIDTQAVPPVISRIFATGPNPWAVAIGRASFFVANYSGNSVTAINRTSGFGVTWPLVASDSPHDILALQDTAGTETVFVDCAGANLIRAIDGGTGALLQVLPAGTDCAVMAFDPAGYLYNTNATANTITARRIEQAL